MVYYSSKTLDYTTIKKISTKQHQYRDYKAINMSSGESFKRKQFDHIISKSHHILIIIIKY